jgi:hypothetical protein
LCGINVRKGLTGGLPSGVVSYRESAIRLRKIYGNKTMPTVDIYNNMVAKSMIDVPALDHYILSIEEGT